MAQPTIMASPTVPVSLTATPSAVDNKSVTKTVCDSKTDYNKDGTINSFDMTVCKQGGGVVPTPTNKTAVDCNNIISDYNSDGIVNSLDRINCLQSQK